MASAAHGGSSSSSDSNNSNDLACVFRAVAQGASAEEVRAILSGGPRTRAAKQRWLAAVVNFRGPGGATPLSLAHDQRRGDLVGALLEQPGVIVRDLLPETADSALALCIAYGQIDSLRVLLRRGAYSADEQVLYWDDEESWDDHDPEGADVVRPVHLCLRPPLLSADQDAVDPPQIECLNVLVREFGADVDGTTSDDERTPFHWLSWTADGHERRAFDALIALGADVNARSEMGYRPIFPVIRNGDLDMLREILARGASPNVIGVSDWTPLTEACQAHRDVGAKVSLLLPLLSVEMRRAVNGMDGCSALDYILQRLSGGRAPEPWERRAIDELLSSRVPVKPDNTRRALPFAARLAERRHAEAARRNRSGAMQWRAHEDLFGLAQDFQELREAEARVSERERRVAELEELRARGIGTEDDEMEEEGGKGGETPSGGARGK